ncbi:hypothetical protein C8R43DRAFT_1203189 [Mycena crocata]|nr:hypothetical protein C8R43DRAFT_1203189 [Mycena crocata]
MDLQNLVPVETWLQVFQACSKNDLRALILVSSYFRDICQPLLFQRQHFSAPHAWVDASTWIKAAEDLQWSRIRLLHLAKSRHASCVHSFTFEGNSELADVTQTVRNIRHIGLLAAKYAEVVHVFAATLGAYKNIRLLRISHLEINSSFRATLSSLDRLAELSMSRCSVVDVSGPVLSLQALSLTASNLKALTIDHSPAALAFMSTLITYSLPVLTHLTMNLSDLALERTPMFAFLEHCLQLIHITLSRPSSFSGAMPNSLPSTAIPNLASYNGPRSLVGLFSHNRPLTVLTRSSVSMRWLGLTIPIAVCSNVCAQIALLLPGLIKLDVRILSSGFSEQLQILSPGPPKRPRWFQLHDDDGVSDLGVITEVADSSKHQRLKWNRRVSPEPVMDERVPYLNDDGDVAMAVMVERRTALATEQAVPWTRQRKNARKKARASLRAIPAIPNRAPRYMYTMSGGSFMPPAELSPPIALSTATFEEFKDALAAQCLAFPVTLSSLKLSLILPGIVPHPPHSEGSGKTA